MAPNLNGTSQKWHLTKTASHENGILKVASLVIEPTLTIRHKLEKLDFKCP